MAAVVVAVVLTRFGVFELDWRAVAFVRVLAVAIVDAVHSSLEKTATSANRARPAVMHHPSNLDVMVGRTGGLRLQRWPSRQRRQRPRWGRFHRSAGAGRTVEGSSSAGVPDRARFVFVGNAIAKGGSEMLGGLSGDVAYVLEGLWER